MAPVNYAELYQQALQQKFTKGLSFNELYTSPNNKNVKFVNAKTIQIPRISVGGYTDVDRDIVGGYTRQADNDYETKTLAHDREFKTLVDPMDIDETNLALSIANITRVFNDEQKIPELDKYAASKLFAEYTDLGGTAITTALTTANVLTVFDQMMEDMDDAEVPQEGRILYTTPKMHTLLKQAQQIQRQLDVANNNGDIKRSVRSLDDVTIKIVPSSRMKTLYNFTDGAVPDAAAKQINIILMHPAAIVAPIKYEFVSLDAPSATTGGKYLYYERAYWDIFLFEKKVPGVKIHVDA